MNYFKGTTQTFTNIQVAPGVYNKNLKMFSSQLSDNEDGAASGHKGLPQGLNDKKNKHQLFISSVYNKTIMLHLSPATGEIQIHELDPGMTFKYSQSILLNREHIYQIQIVDNLIVIHNMEEKSTNMYDVKLAEYAQPVCVDNLDVDTQHAVD